MKKPPKTYDVLIIHSWHEKPIAIEVANACREFGLEPISDEELAESADHSRALWEAIAECRAVVVVLSEKTPTPTMTIQVGAAMAWDKPTYGVVGDILTRLPPLPREIPVYPIGRLDEVIDSIRSIIRQLSDEDRSFLAAIYSEVGLPVDRLEFGSRPLDLIVERFQAGRDKAIPAERLLSELMRLRKLGKLRTTRPTHSKRPTPEPA